MCTLVHYSGPLFFAYFTLRLFPCRIFSRVASCCTRFKSHFFVCCTHLVFDVIRVALFSYGSLFKLHFFRVVRCSCCTFFCVALIWCCTFSVLHFFHIALFSSFTFFVLHSFRVALVSCCTVFMLNFLCVALLHAEPFLVLPYVALC